MLSAARSMDLGIMCPNSGAGTRRRSFALCGTMPVEQIATAGAPADPAAAPPAAPSMHELLCQQVVRQQALERHVQLLEQQALASQAALEAAVNGRSLSLPDMSREMLQAALLAGVAPSASSMPHPGGMQGHARALIGETATLPAAPAGQPMGETATLAGAGGSGGGFLAAPAPGLPSMQNSPVLSPAISPHTGARCASEQCSSLNVCICTNVKVLEQSTTTRVPLTFTRPL